VVSATSTTGPITINNNIGGVIRSVANSPSDVAIATFGGPATLSNAGAITGQLLLGGAGNTVINSGTWTTSGSSSFGGTGMFTNTNIVTLVDPSVTLSGLSDFQNSGMIQAPGSEQITAIFTNAGTINLQNGHTGDTLTIYGNYVGAPGSSIISIPRLRLPTMSPSAAARRGQRQYPS
jgi:hypothetical protein